QQRGQQQRLQLKQRTHAAIVSNHRGGRRFLASMTRIAIFISPFIALVAGVVVAHAAPNYAQPSRQLTVDDAIPGKDHVKRMVILRGLDKITARATTINAPIGVPVRYATLTITARYCYSTPITETPETTAFLQIIDSRPDEPQRKVFSGWMLASS